MPSKNNIWWGCTILAVLLCVFILGRNSKKDVIVYLPTDNSKLIKKNDSLTARNKNLEEINKGMFVTLDSMNSKKLINNKKTKINVEKIKHFTPTDAHRWNDSVLAAEGLK